MRHAPSLCISSSIRALLCNVSYPALFLFRFEEQLASMNIISFIFLITMIGCNSMPDRSYALKDRVIVFAGTTPCGNTIRPIHNIKPEPDCQLNECKCFVVEWELTLYMDAATKQPTHYELKGINR